MTQHDALQLTANKQAYCSRAETHLPIRRDLRSAVNSQMTFAVHYAAFAVALAILTKTWCEAARECPELCVSELAHAGFRYGHALKRSSNMIAN